MLKELRAVRVYIYEGIPDGERMVQQIREIESGLVAEGWTAVVTVHEPTERVSVLATPR